MLDIDGTLVDDSKQIPEVNMRALHAARDRGVHVAIASGRMVPSIAIMEERLGFDCALIAYNGAKVVGPRSEGRRCISHSPVPLEVSRVVAEFARSGGHLLNFYVDDVLYADRSHSAHTLADLYFRRTGAVYEFVEILEYEARPTTKMILLEQPEEVERLHAHFARELSGLSNVVITEREYLEFMANGIDKAAALPTLAAHYGFDVSQVMAVGDADNDEYMLRAAGLGVAVRELVSFEVARGVIEDAVADVALPREREGRVEGEGVLTQRALPAAQKRLDALDESSKVDKESALAVAAAPEPIRLVLADRAEIAGRLDLTAADGLAIALYRADQLG